MDARVKPAHDDENILPRDNGGGGTMRSMVEGARATRALQAVSTEAVLLRVR